MNVLLLLSMVVAFCFGEIYEVSTIAEMDKHKGEGVLFLYDIDNTLVRLERSFGCDQWFQYRFNQLQKQMDNRQEALDKALAEWTSIQYISKPQEVEAIGKDIIASQQREGVMLIGFTTRGLSLSRCTTMQLSTLGFDLSKTAPSKEELFFDNGQGVIFRKGVLFTAGTHKGKALFKFLDMLHVNPSKVVFINDKHQNLAEVEETCLERNMPFTGLRYGFLDEWVNSFNPKVADAQLKSFLDIPSDSIEVQ